ncbi:MAG: hypothetical protein IPM53_27555 [Anaerolineaceae bacterium]|nr:hypothetical protein [Anaerolineaceae bacterium]
MPYSLRALCFIFPFLFILLLGCGAAETDPTSVTAVATLAPDQDGGYPAPDGAYPAPEIIDSDGLIAAESESSVEIPEPTGGLAALGGVFINQRTGKAPLESIVYLGDIVYTDTGLPVIRLDRQTAPFAILEENGEFVFRDIMPAEYAVIFFTPEVSFAIDDSETGETLILNLQPNDKIDLGIVELPVR